MGNGDLGNGTIFRITPDGVFTTLHTVAGDGSEGSSPGALVQTGDGMLYGTTRTSTRSDNTVGSGILFSVTLDGTFTNLGSTTVSNPLALAADGNLYGFAPGGTEGDGLIVRVMLNPAPVINSAETVAGQVGVVFSYQIPATNAPTSFAASGLPAGLSVNAATGLITGVPTVAGNFGVTLSATNSGGMGTTTLTLTIGAVPVVLPVVELTAFTPDIAVNGGKAYAFLLTFSSAPSANIQVAYTIKGSATPGTDYVALKGTAKVKGGQDD